MRPSCNSVISFEQGDLVLHPVMDFCETQPEFFLVCVQLTPSLQNDFFHVPDIGATECHAYSAGETRQSVLGRLRTEIVELPFVQHMLQTTLDQLTKPIAGYHSCNMLASSALLQSYLPTSTAFLLSTLSITMSSLTFSRRFNLFRQQWQHFFRQPQKFIRGTSWRLIHIVESIPADYGNVDTSFLNFTWSEFRALVAIARDTMLQTDAPTSKYTTPCAPSLPLRAYPDIVFPQYAQSFTWKHNFLIHAFI